MSRRRQATRSEHAAAKQPCRACGTIGPRPFNACEACRWEVATDDETERWLNAGMSLDEARHVVAEHGWRTLRDLLSASAARASRVKERLRMESDHASQASTEQDA